MYDRPRFVFATCQAGAERAVKGEVARRWPAFRPAFSRSGFLTFKLSEDTRLHADFDLESVFARTHGISLGKLSGSSEDELARGVWELSEGRPFRRIHVWQRDTDIPGEHGFEPAITPAAIEVHRAIRQHCPRPEILACEENYFLQPALRGEWVLDCCLVEPGEWWVGYHRVRERPSQWPGGIMPLSLPADAVSRAWLKMEEALRWSALPIGKGARCVDIGSAPGGAAQALLAQGIIVTGIDQAEMHPDVLKHPNFSHIRRKAAVVRRRDFRKFRWLTADMSVAPKYTLDCVEEVVTHPEVSIRGLLLTLKLLQWELADEIPEYLARVKSWGYNIVRARQLQSNRQEICVSGLQRPFRRKSFAKRKGN